MEYYVKRNNRPNSKTSQILTLLF